MCGEKEFNTRTYRLHAICVLRAMREITIQDKQLVTRIKLIWELSLKNTFWVLHECKETIRGDILLKPFNCSKDLLLRVNNSGHRKIAAFFAIQEKVRRVRLIDKDLRNRWSITPYSTLHEKKRLWKFTQLFCICRMSCLSRIDPHVLSVAKHS